MIATIISFWHRIAEVVGLYEISTSRVTLDAARRLRRAQIRGAIEQMRVFVVGNTLFAPVLSLQAWGIGIDWLVITWTTIMLGFSWWLFWVWLTSYHTDGAQADMDRFVAETKVNASLWCLGMALFYPYVEGDQKAIVATVMAGSLALGTVGFSQAPPAAFWYLGIHTVALSSIPTLHWVFGGSSQDLLIGVLALVAGGAIFNAALERAKSQMRAFRDHEDLIQKTEVVDLLLKDYEAQRTEWIWRTDADGRMISCPRPVLDALAVHPEDMAKVRLLDAIRTAMPQDGLAEVEKISEAFEDRADLNDITLPFRQASETSNTWIVMKGRPQFDGETFLGYRGIFADATPQVEAKRQIEFLATHDPLTNCPNRNFVHTALDALEEGDQNAAVFLIDLDGFKQVNDGYGHAIGDRLLQAVADRLRAQAGPSDLVARLGGDEFLVLSPLPSTSGEAEQEDLGRRFLTQLSEPFAIDHFEIVVSGSIGLAHFPKDTYKGANMLHLADLALYAAKRSGRNRLKVFEPKMQEGLRKRLLVTERLRKAIQDDQTSVAYQPQFCARTGTLIGAEALSRWVDDELGAVGPDLFIPIAEESGLIQELGEHILRQACLDALSWPTQADGTPLTVAVNLSPVQVMRGNVAQTIRRILSETGFSPERLEIEITEGVLIDDVQSTRFLLEELSDMGIKIALDDFGTGYSSLSYVRALPLNRLKIDRSFVTEIVEHEAQSIVSTIVGLCKRLDLEVVAEGVESREAVAVLRDLGCDILQGYHLSRPLNAQEFFALAQQPLLDRSG